MYYACLSQINQDIVEQLVEIYKAIAIIKPPK